MKSSVEMLTRRIRRSFSQARRANSRFPPTSKRFCALTFNFDVGTVSSTIALIILLIEIV